MELKIKVLASIFESVCGINIFEPWARASLWFLCCSLWILVPKVQQWQLLFDCGSFWFSVWTMTWEKSCNSSSLRKRFEVIGAYLLHIEYLTDHRKWVKVRRARQPFGLKLQRTQAGVFCLMASQSILILTMSRWHHKSVHFKNRPALQRRCLQIEVIIGNVGFSELVLHLSSLISARADLSADRCISAILPDAAVGETRRLRSPSVWKVSPLLYSSFCAVLLFPCGAVYKEPVWQLHPPHPASPSHSHMGHRTTLHPPNPPARSNILSMSEW